MKFFNLLARNKGQTTMEYLLIVVVALSIGVAFKKKVTEFILTNPNSVISKTLGGLEGRISRDTSGRYQWF